MLWKAGQEEWRKTEGLECDGGAGFPDFYPDSGAVVYAGAGFGEFLELDSVIASLLKLVSQDSENG